MLDKICKNLSMQCRFGGDVRRFYSVAEHTVHMVDQARKDGAPLALQLALWLHDAPEAFTGDLLPIVKKVPEIAAAYAPIESRVMTRICHALNISRVAGMNALQAPDVHVYDQAILAAEAEFIANPQPDWEPYDSADPLHVAFGQRVTATEWLADDFPYWQGAMRQRFELIMQELHNEPA